MTVTTAVEKLREYVRQKQNALKRGSRNPFDDEYEFSDLKLVSEYEQFAEKKEG